jgi:hypothetical protein
LQTPGLNCGFEGFNFQLEDGILPAKPVEGPVGPHLFLVSQEPSRVEGFYLSMSPAESPQSEGAAPVAQQQRQQRHRPARREASRDGMPLHEWTPEHVVQWMQERRFEQSVIEHFFTNDISGETLIDLQYDDLKELGITSFGHRHRLWNEIKALKGSSQSRIPQASGETPCHTPPAAAPPSPGEAHDAPSGACPSTDTEEEELTSPRTGQARRRKNHAHDVISPAESVSIVAIEQLLPRPHKCSKGENCQKWQKQQRKLAKLTTEFPNEMAQILDAKVTSPTESGFAAPSVIVPSVVASSDLLGPGMPPVRLEENALRVLQTRDPQENVRQFLNFQHVTQQERPEPDTPPYEMFPPLSPPRAQMPHCGLKALPKLTIPGTSPQDAFSPNRTVVPPRVGTTPVTALDMRDRPLVHDIYRIGSPASEMDVPVTAIPLGPVERDVSSSVPPDMRFGQPDPLGQGQRRRAPSSLAMPPSQVTTPARRNSSGGHHRRPSLPGFTGMSPLVENPAPSPARGTMTPTAEQMNHSGWMKKRKTKMLRHEWQENHFRLKGTQLAMHKDDKSQEALECIDVDDYSVAISTNKSKLNSAMKRLHLNSKRNEGDPAAFAFQLTPAADKNGVTNAATAKTHHFTVNTATERIEWMRELMLARAKKQKDAVHSSFE